jgi:Xaa-Pro aminopeptidase
VTAPAGVTPAPRPFGAPGHMGVDYEQRVDFDRLRHYRITRAKSALEASGCGAFLLFDFYVGVRLNVLNPVQVNVLSW